MRYTCLDCKHISKDRWAITISLGSNYKCDNCGKIYSYRPKGLPIASVYDIDWTLAFFDYWWNNNQQRQEYTGDEPVNTDVLAHLQESMKRNHIIIILTGRKRREWWQVTYDWLRDNDIYYDHLIMQEGSTAKKWHVFKESALKELKKKYNVVSLVDDDWAMKQICTNLKINFIRVDSLWNINL